MKMIAKLALNRITSKKARSAVICAAILLTMVLFMTIVSISVNMVSGCSLMMRMASGTDYHGYLRGATFTLTGEELRDAARQSNDIAEAAVSSNAAQYAMTEDAIHTSGDFIRAIECEKDLQHFLYRFGRGRVSRRRHGNPRQSTLFSRCEGGRHHRALLYQLYR